MASSQELYNAFSQSSYGQELAQRTRFNDFKPDWVGTELWCNVLGDDVNNLRHMAYTHDIAQRFIEEGKLDEETAHILGQTASTHDIGEAVIVDIPLPSKTREDERNEEIAYRAIAKEVFGESNLADVVWSVLNKTDKERGDLFRAIEYVGYCTTAMRAGRMAIRITHGFTTIDVPRKEKEQLVGGLLSLENAVTVGSFPVLTGYVKKYPFIERVI